MSHERSERELQQHMPVVEDKAETPKNTPSTVLPSISAIFPGVERPPAHFTETQNSQNGTDYQRNNGYSETPGTHYQKELHFAQPMGPSYQDGKHPEFLGINHSMWQPMNSPNTFGNMVSQPSAQQGDIPVLGHSGYDQTQNLPQSHHGESHQLTTKFRLQPMPHHEIEQPLKSNPLAGKPLLNSENKEANGSNHQPYNYTDSSKNFANFLDMKSIHQSQPSDGKDNGSNPKSISFLNVSTEQMNKQDYDEKSFRGPPKNSRFFKSLTAEHSRQPDLPPNYIASSHPYNPHLYTQNKSKQGCDFIGSALQSVFMTQPALQNSKEIQLESMENIPKLYPTKEEFMNPIEYIESFKHLGEKYGAIKIVPPQSWVLDISINADSFWFRTRRQLWNGYENEFRARLLFHKQLNEFLRTQKDDPSHKQTFKLPNIDRRGLDLFRFYTVVNLRGGFEKVCHKKLWAQVGREMGYNGRITSSLSSSLKSHYQRILHSFEKHMENQVKEKSSDINYDISPKRNFNEACAEEFDIVQKYKKAKSEGLVDNANQESQMEKDNTETTKVDGCQKPTIHIPTIVSSSSHFVRSKHDLFRKGIHSYFDSTTEYRPGITLDDDQTLSTYDFYKWHGSESTISDSSLQDIKISPFYNLKQFYEKSLSIEKLFADKLSFPYGSLSELHQKFERLYWSLLYNPNIRLEIESSIALPNYIHESLFPVADRYDSEGSSQKNYVLSRSNFNNLPIDKLSVLQYLKKDHEPLLSSYLDCSMFFSTQSWKMEDHFLYSADYLHTGARKLWYFIPESSKEKYETLLKEYIEMKKESKTEIAELIRDLKKEVNYDSEYFSVILENQPFSNSKAPRENHANPIFDEFVSKEATNIYHSDIFLPPSVLKENGIEVYGTYQSAREIVVKFPKAYGSNISFGFNISESVSFAPASWLDYAEEGVSWLSNQQIPSQFSVIKLLLDIISNCSEESIIKAAKPVYLKLYEEEISLRQQVRDLGIAKEVSKANIVDSRDCLTDADLVDTFPSFICLTDVNDATSTFTMSLKYFLENKVYDNKEKYMIELVTYISDENLRHAEKVVSMNTITEEEWFENFKSTIEGYDKPSLKSLSSIYQEGIRAFRGSRSENSEAYKAFQRLREYIQETEEWYKNAKMFLDSRLQTRLRGNRRRSATKDASVEEKENEEKKMEERNSWRTPEELDELLKSMNQLPASVPEMDQLIELANDVLDFEVSVRNLLSKGGSHLASSDNEISALIVLGESFSLKLESLFFLERIMKRRAWLKEASQIADIANTEELKNLIDESELVCSSNDHYKVLGLTELYERVLKINAELKEISSREVIPISTLKSLYKRYDNLPIDSDVRTTCFELIETHSKLYEFLTKIEELPKSIKESFLQADSLIKSLEISLKNFKSLYFLDFIEEVLGDCSRFEDMRVTVLQENVAKYQDFYIRFNFLISSTTKSSDNKGSKDNKNQQNAKRLKGLKDAVLPCVSISQDKNKDFFVEGSPINEKRYCFCRMPENGYMIECEKCTEWFHFNCVGYNDTMDEFVCAMCDTEHKMSTTELHFKKMENAIDFNELKALYEISKSLFIFPEEYDKFIELVKISAEFTEKLREVVQFNGPVCEERDINKVMFYLRKMEGCVVVFKEERDAMRVQLAALLAERAERETKEAEVREAEARETEARKLVVRGAEAKEAEAGVIEVKEDFNNQIPVTNNANESIQIKAEDTKISSYAQQQAPEVAKNDSDMPVVPATPKVDLREASDKDISSSYEDVKIKLEDDAKHEVLSSNLPETPKLDSQDISPLQQQF